MITLMGFGFVVTSALLSYIYSPGFDSPSPNWVYFMHGLLLFLYQTFDAVDGKQARRTNSSSPLGELFDHGCDALSCAFETMAVGNSVMSGRHTIWFWITATIPFYGATWEHFFTNTLILPEINGPTEGLMLIYVAHFFTSIVGAGWWIHKVHDVIPILSGLRFISDLAVYDFVIVCMMLFAVTPTVSFNVYNVYKVVKSRNGSMFMALAMLFPFFLLIGGITLWGWLSPTDILSNQAHLLIIGSGFGFGYMVGRMILAHLCDEPKGLKTAMCLPLLFIPVAIANALSARFLSGSPMVKEQIVLGCFCAYTVCLYLHFAISVIHEITSALGIHCFRIARKEA
ncbi:hypothetical protein KP509_17G081300 [Ceratopteris richardii]|nr:hypothetical protein KP509_17G081300 [Ceratopteris richardii]